MTRNYIKESSSAPVGPVVVGPVLISVPSVRTATKSQYVIKSRAAALAQRGFTLVEIMVVLIILTILMTVFGGRIFSAGDKAKANITRIKMKEVGSYLEQFRLQYNKLPSSLTSLARCTEETGSACTPIANEDSLVDGWGKPLQYAAQGERAYQLKSLGADGRDGGEGLDADLVQTGP